MRKLILYIAISLDAKIADQAGGVEWLDQVPNPDKLDFGYFDFYAGIDTTIMGYTTYKQVIDWGIDFPYPDKKNYVITRKQNLQPTEFVEFISENHIETIKELKAQPGQDIWLVGGGKVNTLFMDAGLVDEMWVHVMPVLLGEGKALFPDLAKLQSLKLIHQGKYDNGVLELRYVAA